MRLFNLTLCTESLAPASLLKQFSLVKVEVEEGVEEVGISIIHSGPDGAIQLWLDCRKFRVRPMNCHLSTVLRENSAEDPACTLATSTPALPRRV